MSVQRSEDLYGLPVGEFVAARNALVKELKAAGDKDGAAVVAKLAKPSVGAWALNQVARSDPDLIEAAIDAGLALREASDAAMAGDASELKAATADDRVASAAVVKAASAHLGTRTEALRQGLVATLRVAALDRDVARQLRLGVLTTELEQPGFGFGAEAGQGPIAPKRSAAKPKLRAVPDLPPDDEPVAKPDAKEAERLKAERAAARAAERQRKKELAAAMRNADRLAREATRLAKEADEAEQEAADARSAADLAASRANLAQTEVDALKS